MARTHSLQTIVVALDGSVSSYHAAEIALQIAQSESHLIEGIYVVDEPLILDPNAEYTQELGGDHGAPSRARRIEWFEERGSSVLDQLQAQCAAKGLPITTEILLGSVPEVILEKAKQGSFLALGRKGNQYATVADHLGGNFRHIAHHAQVPLIVGGEVIKPLKQLFLVYDSSQKADLALKMALRLEQTLSATTIIGLTGHLYLEENPNSLLFRLTEGGIAKRNIIDLRSKPVRKVVDVIMDRQTDLIIMAGYRHPEMMEWLVGSPNDQILRQSPLPAVIA